MSGEATWSKKKKDFLGGLSHHTCDQFTTLAHLTLQTKTKDIFLVFS